MSVSRDYAAIALEYAQRVVSGTIAACKLTIAACQRQLHDLQRQETPGFPFRYEPARGTRVCRMLELLPHIKGRWKSPTIRLEAWQVFIVMTVFSWVWATAGAQDPEVRAKDGQRRFRTAYTEVPRKNAKALSLDTPIPTPSGWTTMGSIRVGDIVFDETGAPCVVTAATDVMYGHDCYRVQFSDGVEIVADAGHEWYVVPRRNGLPRTGLGPRSSWRARHIRTTEQIAQTLDYDESRRERNYAVPVAGGLQIQPADLPVHPYVLGVWLGDGTSASATFTCAYQDRAIVAEVAACGYSVSERESTNPNSGLYRLDEPRGTAGRGKAGRTRRALADLGVLNSKHIPPTYLRASFAQRIALLQGLMDTDGTVSKAGQCAFATTSPQLRDGVLELARSLGFKPTLDEDRAVLNGRDCGPSYRIQFWAFSDTPVFRLPRKAFRQRPYFGKTPRSRRRQIVAAERVDSVPVRCIQVSSPSNLYLAGAGMVPTHNSTLTAGIGLYMLAVDGEQGAECYSAATTKDQARIVFDIARAMAKRTPRFCEKFGVAIGTHALTVLDTESVFKALSSEDNSLDGLNPHAAIIDELHAHKTRGVYDVLETATGSRAQSLLWVITTAGTNRAGVCYEVRTYLTKILDDVAQDETFFGIIYSLDDGDDWTDPRTWAKANPNYGVSVFPDDIARLCRKAQELPSAQPNFLTKRLNVWVNADSPWMDMRRWEACADPKLAVEQFAGEECVIALDLASNVDIAARVDLFRRIVDEPTKDGGTSPHVHYYAFGRFYVPEDVVEESDNSQYKGWERAGRLIATDGNIIDQNLIQDDLRLAKDQVQIREVAYDPFQATKFATELLEEGFPMVEMGATVKNFSAPMKEIEALVKAGRLHHDGDPVLAWMMSNVVCHVDRKDNVFPVKQTSKNKIDGAVALIMAMGRAMHGSDDDWRPV